MLNTAMLIFVVALLLATLVFVVAEWWRHRVPTKRTRSTSREIPECDLPVSVTVPAGEVAVFSLHQKDKTKVPYAWAMISVLPDSTEAVLWDIYVRENYRRMGYGKKLIQFLQTRYNSIYTEYEKGIVNSAGVRLCVACGFKMKPQMFKNAPPELSWHKGWRL
jgi:ribosomal protein S18 acetylase RimI-like enzyme